MRFSAVDGFKKKELTQWAKKHLWPSSLVVSDGLACFRGIEEANSFHLGIVTGGGPDSVKLPYFKWVNTQGESMSVHFSLTAVIPATMTCSR